MEITIILLHNTRVLCFVEAFLIAYAPQSRQACQLENAERRTQSTFYVVLLDVLPIAEFICPPVLSLKERILKMLG